MKVFFTGDSNFFWEDAKDKGILDDIFLLHDNKYYKLTIYDKTRLLQDVEEEIATSKVFTPIPNLIIVNRITYEDVFLTLKNTIDEGIVEYFYSCKIVDGNIVYIESKQQIETFIRIGIPFSINKKDLKELIME